jgi:hypothetical protein
MPIRTGPRRTTLLGLGTLVLAGHLLLLAGPLPMWDSHQSGLPSLDLSRPEPAAPGLTPDPDRPTPTQATVPAPVLHSQVRWIAPTPAPAPAALPAPPAPAETAVARQTDRPRPAPAPSAVATPDHSVAMASPEAPATAAQTDVAPAAPASVPAEPPAAASSAVAESHLTAAPAEPEPPRSTAASATGAAGLAGGPAQVVDSTVLPYTVRGEIRGIPYRASARLAWQRDGDRYEATLEVRALLMGSRTQTSVGRITPQGLQPERFSDRSRSEKAAHFDADGQRIRFSNNAPDAALLAGAQDRLSVFLQLGALFNARPQAFVRGQELQLQVAGTGSAEIWQFSLGPEETLDLPVGPVQARHLTRAQSGAYGTTVEVWLAPGLAHLPVRIRLTQASGDLIDQQLEQWPALPKSDSVRRAD